MKHVLKYIDIIALFILGVIASFCGFIVYTMLCIGYMIWEFKAPDFLITSFQKDLERCYIGITIDNRGFISWLDELFVCGGVVIKYYPKISNTEEGSSADRMDNDSTCWIEKPSNQQFPDWSVHGELIKHGLESKASTQLNKVIDSIEDLKIKYDIVDLKIDYETILSNEHGLHTAPPAIMFKLDFKVNIDGDDNMIY